MSITLLAVENAAGTTLSFRVKLVSQWSRFSFVVLHSGLDTLFLTLPVSWHGTIAQYVGRLHRLYDTKKEVRVYDFADLNVPMLSRMTHLCHSTLDNFTSKPRNRIRMSQFNQSFQTMKKLAVVRDVALTIPVISPCLLGGDAMQFLSRLRDESVHITFAKDDPFPKSIAKLSKTLCEGPDQFRQVLAALRVDVVFDLLIPVFTGSLP